MDLRFWRLLEKLFDVLDDFVNNFFHFFFNVFLNFRFKLLMLLIIVACGWAGHAALFKLDGLRD